MYGKLFSQTFSGSMVGKGSTVFAIWAYVVAHTKPPGIVELNPVLIAAQIGTTAADVESAIEYLCAADPNSRTPDHEGRRMIREGQFQYSVPNYMRYRGLRNEEERREQDRERKRRSREAHKGNGAKPPADDSLVIATLPLIDGTEYEIRESLLSQLEPLYPLVDIKSSLPLMKGWLISKPERRKTRRGIKAFITSWLAKEQAQYASETR